MVTPILFEDAFIFDQPVLAACVVTIVSARANYGGMDPKPPSLLRKPPARALPEQLVCLAVIWRLGLLVLGFISGWVPTAVLANATTVPQTDTRVQWVGRFDPGLAPWRVVRLQSVQRPNTFRFTQWDGVMAVEVISEASMSLLARSIAVDLNATPVLCWRWRISATLSQADMRQREGDDYAARVYVSFRLPSSSLGLGLRAQLALARAIWGPDVPDAAINYVWDNRQPVGTTRHNAYTDRAQMVVLRSGDGDAGRWVWERVHVRHDVTRLFGQGAEPVQLAITADTDNTKASARSGFADFHFVPIDSPCDEQPR